MKKTEKIEVRLSHEEKAELSKLADEEGRSVSELIRHLVKRYMSVNTGRLPRKLPWLALAATGIIAFLAGHLLTYFIAKSHVDETNYKFYVHMDRKVGDNQRDNISVPIFLKDGFSQELTMPSANGDVKIDIFVGELENGLFNLQTRLCRQAASECEMFATPYIILRENTDAYIRFETRGGLKVDLGVAIDRN